VTGHDLKFWRPLQSRLNEMGHFEFREDEWRNHDEHDHEHTVATLAWADVIVAEWALGNAVFAARHKLPHQKLIVRLHLQERNTAFPSHVDWQNVDQVLFVGPHILLECVEKFSIPQELCQVLGNFVDCERFARPKLDGVEFTLGLLGSVPSRKRLDRALDVLEKLAAYDDRYTLRVKGESPAGYEWLWQRKDEREYYESLYRRINGSPNLRHRVIFDPPADDVPNWLRLVGVMLSPSDFESFHMAVAEAAAASTLPIVWDWEGVRDIYPEVVPVGSIEEAVSRIRTSHADREQSISAIRAGVCARYGIEGVIDRWADLLRSPPLRLGRMHSTDMRSWITSSSHRQVDLGRSREISDIKVALLCDEFTYNSFKNECRPIVIEPDNWRDMFEKYKPDLFFCESAWSGVDSKRRPWKGRVYASSNFRTENRKELLEILAYCKEHQIPTVFWNKEDPSHYEDKIHNFVDTAKLFDVVFTTDLHCVERYKNDHGLQRVGCLPFASNPRIFNPVETDGAARSNDVVFAGSWYANHEDRCDAMQSIFDEIIGSGRGLAIYDRFYGSDDDNHRFPDAYRGLTRPAVAHSEIDRVYKSSVFGLNMNTETQSPTMFARRVYELMSCNTLCLSNYSVGMEQLFGDSVIFLDRSPGCLASLSLEEIERKRDWALHEVLRKHTYKERFKTILDAASIPYADRAATLTFVCVVDSHETAQQALAYLDRQAAIISGGMLLLVVADTVPDIEVAGYYERYNRFGVAVVSWSCVERYGQRPAGIVKTGYFALVEPRSGVPSDYIANAFLHTVYAGDSIIAMGQAEKYRYAQCGVVRDVIADSRWFLHLMRNRGRSIAAPYYSV